MDVRTWLVDWLVSPSVVVKLYIVSGVPVSWITLHPDSGCICSGYC
jgi:hypothetical protein